MKELKVFDCIIVGGGLAGLSLAILLAQKEYNVLLIEKKSYPYHKVCGEYISMESWNFITRLGIPLDEMNLPRFNQFKMTSVSGKEISEDLSLGGFGISRYTLDDLLAKQARALGVTLLEKTTCTKLESKATNLFQVHTSNAIYQGKLVCAGFGRHSFGNFYKPVRQSQNWMGVKYHVKGDFPANQIALHTFKNGYCGMSKVDGDTYCLCYLVNSSVLKKFDNNLARMEQEILFRNVHLKQIFQQASFIYQKPLTISNISFSAKKPFHEGIFYMGDASGSIAPLTGNGMSNAMRSAFILSQHVDAFLTNRKSLKEISLEYEREWNQNFKSRLKMGRFIQYFFCQPTLTPIFLFIMGLSSTLRKFIIKQTHGNPF